MLSYIETKGTHYERGFQQGEKLRKEIHDAIDFVFNSEFFKEMVPPNVPAAVVKKSLESLSKKYIEKPIRENLPNQWKKLTGIEKGADISHSMALLSQVFEIINGLPKFVYKNAPKETVACSFIGATKPATIGGETIIGRNYDFPNVLEHIQLLKKEFPDNGYAHIALTQLPLVGNHVAMNEKGLVICLNYGRCWKQRDFNPHGVPSTIIVQEVIENCADVDEAIKFITNISYRANGAFYCLGDESGNLAVLETTHSRYSVREPKNGILAHTNVYIGETIKDANLPDEVRFKMASLDISPIESPKRRYKRIYNLVQQYEGKITEETIKSILRDHDPGHPDEQGPNDCSICTHGISSGTLASLIIKPKSREFHVINTHPCSGEYIKYTL